MLNRFRSAPIWLARALTLLLVSAAASAGAARAADRVALVIGEADYRNPELQLRNPASDARGTASALQALGFRVTTLVDADRSAASAALAAFADAASGADTALVFFAGHGVQIDDENYLLTSDFNDRTLDEVRRKSITLGEIRAALARARPGVGVVLLDACRNNPFTDAGLVAPGLAKSPGGPGLLIAFATDPGNVARDGATDHSAFTAALLENIAAPGIEMRLMFGRVRMQVVLATGGLQVPWVEESVLGEHYFNPEFTGQPLDPGITRDVQAWRTASAEDGRDAYATYLADYPDGLFHTFANERLSRLGRGGATGEPELSTTAAQADLVSRADHGQLAAALSTLGFLSPARGESASDPELETALAAYEKQMTDGGVTDLDQICLDAAQVTLVLAAATGQRIRTDLTALAAVETTLGMADRARAELAGLAVSRASARPALAAADGDIAAIRAARERVLERLDASRSYYAELLERGRGRLRPYLGRSLAGLLDGSRSPQALEQRNIDDAATFIRQATTLAAAKPEGSYAWIADYLPQQN